MKSSGLTWRRFAIWFFTVAVPIGIVLSVYVLIVTGTAWPEIVAIAVSATLLANALLSIPNDLKNEWSRAEVWRRRANDFFNNAVFATLITGFSFIADVGSPPSLSQFLLLFLGGFLVASIALFLIAVLLRQPRNILRSGRQPVR